jgi:plasmid maintenance system antidote protein VapI
MPEVWLRLQGAYDLAQAQKKKIKVRPFEPA